MKQKNRHKLTRLSLTAALLLLLVFSSAGAQTPLEELQENIDEKQNEINKLQNEIQDYQGQIQQRQRAAASLKNEVDLFDLQIRQTEIQISVLQLEIDKLNEEIKELQIRIQKTEEEIIKQKRFLAETLRLINEYDSYSPLEITLGNDTFSQFLDQVEYANNLQEKNQELLEKVRALKAELEEKQNEVKKKLAEQEAAKAQLDAALHSLEQQRGGKQALLSRTRGEERIYQSLLGEAAQKQEEVNREIFELEVEIRQRVGDTSLPPVKGLLQWPASGILTQGYGNTGFTSLGYSFHNGLDIAGPPGTKIYAAGDGVVYAAGSGEAAYGNWLVLKHTIDISGQMRNIYTLYAHLQSFAVSTGNPVKGGDIIGYMGNTGNTTRLLYGPERGYHLHFTIFAENGFSIKEGAYQHIYGSYRIPVGVTYDPVKFLK